MIFTISTIRTLTIALSIQWPLYSVMDYIVQRFNWLISSAVFLWHHSDQPVNTIRRSVQPDGTIMTTAEPRRVGSLESYHTIWLCFVIIQTHVPGISSRYCYAYKKLEWTKHEYVSFYQDVFNSYLIPFCIFHRYSVLLQLHINK